MSPCELSHLIDRVRIGTLLDMEMAMPRTAQASVPALLPIMGSVFISFLIIGVAMPVLPLHVHQGLGLGTFIVGLVAGSQFAASLVSRVWAGRHADGRGAKHAVATGLALAAVLLVAPLRRVAPTARVRHSLTRVVAAVWLPGLGLALTSAGFGAMTAFVALLFAARGWTVWPAFTTFAVAFIVARMLLGHLADRMGGAKVALTCLLIEAAGQALLWLAPSSLIALIGAALTGFGYSLVYPGFGVEAVLRAPAECRGLPKGRDTAFLDVALALASPALGLIAAMSDIGTVFLASALSVLCAAPVALRLKGMR